MLLFLLIEFKEFAAGTNVIWWLFYLFFPLALELQTQNLSALATTGIESIFHPTPDKTLFVKTNFSMPLVVARQNYFYNN